MKKKTVKRKRSKRVALLARLAGIRLRQRKLCNRLGRAEMQAVALRGKQEFLRSTEMGLLFKLGSL